MTGRKHFPLHYLRNEYEVRLKGFRQSLNILSFTIILTAIFPSNASAQSGSVSFRHLSVAEGLSQSSVFAFAQDSLGFLWVGTEDGLNRYDGYSFKIYKHEPSNSISLSNSWIECLYVDHRGVLWIGTFGGGLNRYDQQRDRFVRYEHLPEKHDGLPNNFVRAITEGSDGSFWIGTQDGLSHFNPRSQTWKTFRNEPENPQSLSHNHIRALLCDKRGRLWIGTVGGGVNRYDEKNGSFIRFMADPKESPRLSHNNVRTIIEDDSGRIWAGTKAGLDRFDERLDSFVPLLLPSGERMDENVYDVVTDNRGSLWIGTNLQGVIQYDLSSGTMRRHQHEPTDPHSLTTDNNWRLFRDRSGVIWVGTLGGGMNSYSGIRKPFFYLQHMPLDTNSLFASITWSIVEDRKGILWMGTDGETLNRYDPVTGIFSRIPFDQGNRQDSYIRAMVEDRNGTLWVGAGSGWFGMFDRQRSRFVKPAPNPRSPDSIGQMQIRSMIEDDQGMIWIGTSGEGLCRFDPRSGMLNKFRHTPEDSQSLSSDMIVALLNDNNGKLWVGTREGLNRFDPADGRSVRFRFDPADTNSLSSDYVNCILKDRQGKLWVGTRSGLNRLNEADRTFRRYFEKDGLPNDVVYGILEDQQGFLWLSTNRGLSKFDPSTETFRNFDESDGTGGNEFNGGAFCKGRNGILYFGGVHGVTAFNPVMIADNPFPPPVVFTNFEVFGSPVAADRSFPVVSEITLEYGERFFSFEYAALDFTSPGKNHYAYRLEGFDEEWIDAGTRRFGSYTNLDPGKYALKIKAANSDGIWNEKANEIILTVAPAYWQTLWFRGLIILFVIAGVSALYRYRVNRLLAVERMRNRIARDLHDDVSATLSGINYFAESIDRQSNELTGGARRFLNLIAESAVSAQESINDIVWSLNPDNDSWQNVLTKFRRYASDLFDSKGIQYAMNVPDSLNISSLDMERRRDLWLIYKEMTTNIARHSGCTEAEIRFSSPDRYTIELFVRDNGKGFDPGSPTDRNGLKNIRSRAQKLRSEISLDTAPGNGVQWTLRFRV